MTPRKMTPNTWIKGIWKLRWNNNEIFGYDAKWCGSIDWNHKNVGRFHDYTLNSSKNQETQRKTYLKKLKMWTRKRWMIGMRNHHTLRRW